MKHTDLKIFSSMMAMLSEVYGKVLSQNLVEVYWQILKDFDLEEVSDAFKRHLHNPDAGMYFPKPADIVGLIDGSSEGRALKAWTQVQTAIERVGRYQSVAFEDPIIHAVIADMGGWIQLCQITFKDLTFFAHEFKKRYQNLSLHPLQHYPPYLVGVVEQDNSKEGFAFKAPVLIGDPEKAKTVMQGGTKNHHQITHNLSNLMESILKIQQRPDTAKEE